MKFYLAVLLVLLSHNPCFGAEFNAMKGDTSVRKMREVDITADYVKARKNSSFAPLTILTNTYLAALGGWQVSDAIAQLPSAYINNYGGLNALKTISLRATTSQQSLVLLDGVRIGSSANGSVDLSAIPLVFFDEIELSGGGSSAQNGGGAMAGVVNLRTNITTRNTFNFSLFGGSFGDALLSAAANFSELGVGWNIGGEFLRSDGNYPFSTTEFGKEITLQRTNSDFRNLGCTLSGTYDASAWKINNSVFIRTSERGSPGAVLQGSVEQLSARLGEDDILFVTSGSRKVFDNSTLKLSGSARYSNLRFRDKDALYRGPSGADDLYITREAMVSAKNESVTTNYRSTIELEWTFADLRGNTFQPKVGNLVHRHTISAIGSIEKEWNIDSQAVLSTQLQARYDGNSNASNAFSPLIGMLLRKDNFPIRVRGSWSYNFRLPSFNELYYFNYGTANLRPERAHSLNIGTIWQGDSPITGELNGFIISTQDQILAVPKSPISWSAQNIGSVLSRGVECSASGQFWENRLQMRFSYTRQIATDETSGSLTYKKILPAVPQELVSSSFILAFGQTSMGGSLSYSSFRYSTADNTPELVVPSYLQLNSYAEHTFETGFTSYCLRIECNNLLNTRYSVIINYPMPARSFRLGLRMKITSEK